MPTTSDQPSNYQPIRFIVNDPGFDTELGLKGRGYSPDNGQTFIVQDTTDGRIYRIKDANRLFPLLKPLFDPYYSGGTVSLHWGDILDKPDLVTEDQLKTIKLTPGPPGKDGSPGKDGENAYQVAVDNGFAGSIQDWLKSLQGKPGRDGLNGEDGHDGVTPHIDATTGNWFIGTTNTGVKAQGPAGKDGSDGKPGSNGSDGAPGKDGVTPHIDTNTGHWFIGDTDTGIDSRGRKGDTGNPGNPGRDGQNGITPHIDSATGHWFIGTTDTGVSARGPQGLPGKDGAPGRDGKDATDTVQVITSGTLASLGIGKYEIQESASDAPTDDWGLLEVTVGQHYAKQVFTITGNGRNMIYSRVRDYDAADYGPWHAISNTIDTSSKTTNKLPSDYQDGIFYEVKSVSSIGINRSDSDWSAQQGTTAILTTKVYDGLATQTAEIVDGTRPIVYMRVGKQSVWYAWEANTTW